MISLHILLRKWLHQIWTKNWNEELSITLKKPYIFRAREVATGTIDDTCHNMFLMFSKHHWLFTLISWLLWLPSSFTLKIEGCNITVSLDRRKFTIYERCVKSFIKKYIFSQCFCKCWSKTAFYSDWTGRAPENELLVINTLWFQL